MEKNHIKTALDTHLSEIQCTKSDIKDVLSKAKGEVVVRKKISLGLVLALALILVAIVAVAATLLSGKEFVEQVMVPKVVESESSEWTQGDLQTLLRIANENSIVLPDNIKQMLEQSNGESKEEIMRIFAKTELGFFPATWNIEDQAWYDKLLVDCGLADVQTRFVPEGDEIPFERALEVVLAHINNTYGYGLELSRYRCFVEYRQFIDENEVPRKWYMTFEALSPSLDSYDLIVSPAGDIEESILRRGIRSMQGVGNTEAVFDYYHEEYGLHYEWSQSVWESFQKDLARAVETYGHSGRNTIIFLKQVYGTPDANAITVEKAIDYAGNAIISDTNLSREDFLREYTARALYFISGEKPIWKVNFTIELDDGPYRFMMRYAEVNAYTGEVMNIGFYDPEKGSYLFEAFVEHDTLQDDPNAINHG